MIPIFAFFGTFLILFSMGLVSLWFRHLLPSHHLSTETKDTVKLAMGLVASMTALVLGLLVASAKGSYDSDKADVTSAASKIPVLDRCLAHYGPDAADARKALRDGVASVISDLWPSEHASGPVLEPNVAVGEAIFESVQALKPTNPDQVALKSQALGLVNTLSETRWRLYEQTGGSISRTLVLVVISWLALIFFSFGLFAPNNGTAVAALLVSAFAVSGAILLILELDHPFDGFIQLPSRPMVSALEHLGR